MGGILSLQRAAKRDMHRGKERLQQKVPAASLMRFLGIQGTADTAAALAAGRANKEWCHLVLYSAAAVSFPTDLP